ncbi:hypothetical protein Patl1_32259 [Pistacia atlantica]|uniref:Uncharacterized protein n=1 Tax=Pistacia atlantica TaxID=434234 RepID=A0ACC1APV2_9ROSI|nr:hypothetical protein Patl1_32259 [Pistacia atlantica]
MRSLPTIGSPNYASEMPTYLAIVVIKPPTAILLVKPCAT